MLNATNILVFGLIANCHLKLILFRLNLVLFFYRNKSSFTHSSKQLLVKMTVLLILDYGDVVYRSASKTLLHKLDVIYLQSAL